MTARRRNLQRKFAAALLAALGSACACSGTTNLDPVDYALVARSVTGAALSSNGWTVTLDEARVGFGPLYVCASVSASPEFCEAAVAEFAEVAAIDLRSTRPVEVGRIRGFSDTVHSAFYDYGITWRTGSSPTPASTAPEGHALIMRGTATSAAGSVRFEILIDAAPLQAGSYAVLARIPEKLQSSRIRLELLFDPGLWLGKLDFARVAAQAQPVVLTTADPMGNAIATTLMSDARPTFNWIDVP